jgi:hypothetical protein
MFTKSTIALVIVIGLASAAVAAPKHSTNPGFDVYNGGKYVGSDPDSRIRMDLRRDHGVTE